MRTNNQGSNPRPENKDIKGKHGRKVRQETLLKKEENSFDKKKEALQNELQGFMYSQSSKLSSVSRNLIFGILGTIWIMTYVEGKLTIPTPQLFYALLISLFFLAVDVLHYFLDSISYHHQQYNLDTYKTFEELRYVYDRDMDRINKRSHRFIIWKTLVLFIASMLFVWGILDYIPSFSVLLSDN